MKRVISRCCCMIGGSMAAVGAMGLDTESAAGFLMVFALTAAGFALIGIGMLIKGSSTMALDSPRWEKLDEERVYFFKQARYLRNLLSVYPHSVLQFRFFR